MDSLDIIPILLMTFVLLMVGLATYAGYQESPTGECNQEIYTLQAVNGFTDKDTGLFSSGDTSKTSMLMTDGTIITLNYRINTLKIGKQMVFDNCKRRNGDWFYTLKGDSK